VPEIVTTESRVRVVPAGPPEGVVSLSRRVSDLGIGAASIGVGAMLDAVERFRPNGSAERHREPTLLREVARAATGMAIVAEERAVGVAEAVELTAQRAVEVGTQVPIVRDALVGISSFLGRWSSRADIEQARRRAETTDFFARMIPAVVDAVIERIDVGAIVQRVPLAEIVGAIDLDALLDQVDLNEVLAHVDVGRLLDRIDVEGVVDRVDADALVQRVDVSALLARVDMVGIVGEVLDEIDIGAIVRESTGSITGDAVDGARVTAMRIDTFVGRVADRVLLRGANDRSGLPVPTEDGADA
jgi:hypothetical protein